MRLPHSIHNVHLARRLLVLLKKSVEPGTYEGDWTTLGKPGVNLSFVDFSSHLRALAGVLERAGFQELGSALRYSTTFDMNDGRMHVGRAHSGIRQLTRYLGEFDAGLIRKKVEDLKVGDKLVTSDGLVSIVSIFPTPTPAEEPGPSEGTEVYCLNRGFPMLTPGHSVLVRVPEVGIPAEGPEPCE